MELKELKKSRFMKTEFWTHIIPLAVGLYAAFAGLPAETVQHMTQAYSGAVEAIFQAFGLLMAAWSGIRWGHVTTEQKKAIADAEAMAVAAGKMSGETK